MLGGGVFVTQNKALPGSYINIVNASSTVSTVGERGVVAIALPLNKSVGEVIEVSSNDFTSRCYELLNASPSGEEVVALREIFRHANKVYVYDLGEDGTATQAIAALEPYEFNILCAYTDTEADITAYMDGVKKWRDELGKKCQVVVYNQGKPDHEGIINVVSTVTDEGAPAYALVAWVAGAEAACKINESCTNMRYDGEYAINVDKTQEQLVKCIEDGQIAFHLVYGEVRMVEDVNSFVTIVENKGVDLKYNQTIRVIDQIANDIAKLFGTKYLGKIPNNASGRVSLWADIVAHHKELERINAIEKFDSSMLTVEQGVTKKSVVINDSIKVINAMAQLYMTVVIQ